MTDRSPRGRWLRQLALAWSALLAVPLLMPYVDLSFSSLLPVVQALWPLSALVAVVTLLACLGLRQWVAAGVVAAALVVGLLPGVLVGSGADPAGGGETLTVLAANVEFSQGDPQDVADLVREHRVGVLVLLEIDPGFLERLRATGLGADLPHGWDRPVSGGASGTTILTRMPQTEETRWPAGYEHRFQMPVVRVELGGREVVVRAVHTLPPAPAPAPDWRAELDGLDSWVDDVPADTDLVLAGDFNAGRSHPAFREVADGFTIAPGLGSRTWPEDGRFGRFADIDHVLARGLAPRAAGSATVDGSDHRAVWAELAYDEGSG